MSSKSARDKYFDDLKFECKRQPTIESSFLNHIQYGDKDIWFGDYPLGGFKPISNASIGMEKLILDKIGKRDGLKLVHPRASEVMEIAFSEKGQNFLNNVLWNDDYYRKVNNGVVIERVPDGYIAREIIGVQIENRMVPSETLLTRDPQTQFSTVTTKLIPEGVVEILKVGDEKKLPLQKEGELYFKKEFSGIVPSEMMSYGESRQKEDTSKDAKLKFPGVWNLYNSRFNRENLALVSSYLANGGGDFGLGVFPMKSKEMQSVIPLFTRENPKK